MCTPEKWDGISRSWQNRGYVQLVGLLVIDEIHLLGADRCACCRRGSSVVPSRRQAASRKPCRSEVMLLCKHLPYRICRFGCLSSRDAHNTTMTAAAQDCPVRIYHEPERCAFDRGPILEVIVSRMRYISSQTKRNVRFVGLSTAVANAQDLADWLGIGSKVMLAPSDLPYYSHVGHTIIKLRRRHS